jgi:hypothetical protein
MVTAAIEKYLGGGTTDRKRLFRKNTKHCKIAPAGWTPGTPHDPKLTSRIDVYPGRVQSIRGFGADLIIVDEAAHVNQELFTAGIVPVLTTTGVSMLALTTSDGPDNFFSKLMETKNPRTGGPLFQLLDVQLSCVECRKAGKAENCTHKRDAIPSWKPVGVQEKVKVIMEAIAGPELYKQEILGGVHDSRRLAFKAPSVARFELAPSVPVPTMPFRDVWMFIDPHGGGLKSSQAIVTLACTGDRVTVSRICTDMPQCAPARPYARTHGRAPFAPARRRWSSTSEGPR